jgi:hypothetical protein
MDTKNLFSVNRTSKRINETLAKKFGTRLNLESFDLHQLQDARNKLRTQISQIRQNSNFNENLENDAFLKAQFMLDAINAEIAEREEYAINENDTDIDEGAMKDVDYDLRMIANDGDEEELISALQGEMGSGVADVLNDMMSELQDELAAKGMNDVINDNDKMIEMLWDKLVDEYGGDDEYNDDGGETDDEYALASAGFGSDEDYGDFGRDESIQGEAMKKVTEGEVQQASAIVTAKTMVDRVGRWIEELSGMENETLLQLGDSIRDEMGQEQSRAFIEQVAPAIQQALETLKDTRETLSAGVNTLATGEQPADMLGAEPEVGAEGDMTEPAPEDGAEMPAEEPVGDEFAAAEPAAGGAEAAGREQRESVSYQNRLLKVLAG